MIPAVEGSEAALIPSLRQGLQLLILSGLGVLLAGRLFRKNAATSRMFAICCAIMMLGFPLTWLFPTFVLPVPMSMPLSWLPEVSVPGLVPLILFGSGAVLAMRTMILVFRQQLRYAALTSSTDPLLVGCLKATVDQERGGALPVIKLVDGGGPASGTMIVDAILLPMHASTWSESTLRAVFSHELMHIRRRDDRWLLLMRVLTDVYWWMPWLKKLERRCRESIEESCDDIASEFHTGSDQYLMGVLVVARDHLSRPRQLTITGMVASGSAHLLERVRRFSGFRFFDTEAGHVYWACVGMLVTALVAAGVKPVVLAKTKPAVSSNAYALRLSTPLTGKPTVSVSILPLSSSALLQARVDSAEIFTPLFPGLALRSGREGEVRVRFDLTADGTAVRPTVTQHMTPELDDAAVQAVRRMHFPSIHEVRVAPLVLEAVSARGLPTIDRPLEARIDFRLNRAH